ncbi:hypothetical protein T11_14360 [Trichinella zimbabwensis]|uniref:Uncharacterized protein n=1 Tax=Trichinella zimbabwensis TaxID=268475 RepID=A0A0V1HN78_9BILA|nr:hypothetical protein T11_14360 [Trichinella zimbabwensis]
MISTLYNRTNSHAIVKPVVGCSTNGYNFSHAMKNQKCCETLNFAPDSGEKIASFTASQNNNNNDDDDDDLEKLLSITQYEFGNPSYSKAIQSTDITVYIYRLWMPVLKMSLCVKKRQTESTVAGGCFVCLFSTFSLRARCTEFKWC